MKFLSIVRGYFEDKQTLGKGFVFNDNLEIEFEFKTLELPWLDNKVRESCIPEGIYKVKKRYSKKFKQHFHITNVPNRTYILIHAGNYHNQILGCVLCGDSFRDINNDGYRDVLNSQNTLTKLLDIMPDEFKIIITDNPIDKK